MTVVTAATRTRRFVDIRKYPLNSSVVRLHRLSPVELPMGAKGREHPPPPFLHLEVTDLGTMVYLG